jgi:ribosomal protein L14E/L6E/L27E
MHTVLNVTAGRACGKKHVIIGLQSVDQGQVKCRMKDKVPDKGASCDIVLSGSACRLR